MVQKSQARALVHVLILCLMLQNSSANLCSRTFEASLKQTKQLIMYIEDKTKQLYESYLTHQGLHDSIAALFCHHSISEFPKRDITKETDRKMLKKLYKTLQHMKNSLAVIQEQQRSLNYKNASLHVELKRAQLSVAGLLQNTECALKLQGLTLTSITPRTRPTPRNSFDVKIEGCRVLWNYSQFISHLSQTFKGRLPERAGHRNQKRDADGHIF